MKVRAYLDIETTGLSRNWCDLTVIGIFLEKNRQCQVIQLIENDLSEGKLLKSLKGVDEVYTYNGSRFDLPFIKARLGVNLKDCFKHTDLTLWTHIFTFNFTHCIFSIKINICFYLIHILSFVLIWY